MQNLPQQTKLKIDGPAGAIEALLEMPKSKPPVACAVVCHPHPMHGGTMQNKVAHTLARGFAGLDFAALRFNFRGVGASAGEFDNGVGELADILAVVAWAREQYPGQRLWLAGFSFGAALAIQAAVEVQPAGLISIAPAVSRVTSIVQGQPDCPWLILQGDEDELVNVDDTIAWVNQLEPGPQLEILEGAEHFFHGRLIELRDAVQDFVRQAEARL